MPVSVAHKELSELTLKQEELRAAKGRSTPTLFVIYLHYKGKRNKSKCRKYFFTAKKAANFLVKIHRKKVFREIKWVNNLTGIRIYQQEYKNIFVHLIKSERIPPNGVLTKITDGFHFCCEVFTRGYIPIFTNCRVGFRQNIKIDQKELN